MFAGDTFGVSYRELASERGAFILPTTTPVQFEPEALHGSVDRLLGFEPQVAYLTHYSCVGDVEQQGPELHRRIDGLVALARGEHGKPDRSERLRAGVRDLFLRWTRDLGTRLPSERVVELLGADVELNAQGLETWLDRNRR
jgi:hypothetical protein